MSKSGQEFQPADQDQINQLLLIVDDMHGWTPQALDGQGCEQKYEIPHAQIPKEVVGRFVGSTLLDDFIPEQNTTMYIGRSTFRSPELAIGDISFTRYGNSRYARAEQSVTYDIVEKDHLGGATEKYVRAYSFFEVEQRESPDARKHSLEQLGKDLTTLGNLFNFNLDRADIQRNEEELRNLIFDPRPSVAKMALSAEEQAKLEIAEIGYREVDVLYDFMRTISEHPEWRRRS